MKKIFEPISLGGLSLRNRILRSATLTDKDSQNGIYLPNHAEVCNQLSKNKVACVISGMICVGANSSAADFAPRADHKDFFERFKEACDAIHKNKGKFVAQLAHAGANAMVFDSGENPWAPSDILSSMGFEAKEMTLEQIDLVIKDFAKAAKICKEAGADAVQLHGAHAYLISQFLSPYYNKRSDEYGGTLDKRARFLFDVYRAVKESVGKDYPIWIKVNYDDLIGEGGSCGDDCIWVCKEMEKLGVDAIEISSGLALDRESRPMQKALEGAMVGHFTEGALKIAEAVDADVISVGGYRTKEQIENCLNLGKIKAIAMSRPFADPKYIADWE